MSHTIYPSSLLRVVADDGMNSPRLFNCCMEYWTGYRAKFKDGPVTAGFLSLHFSPGARADHTVLPISTVGSHSQPWSQIHTDS